MKESRTLSVGKPSLGKLRVASFAKNKTEDVVIEFCVFSGRVMLKVGIVTVDPDGVERPTKRTFLVRLGLIQKFGRAISTAERLGREKGWIR